MIRMTGLFGLLLAASCQQTVTPPPVRSLAQSGNVSLICRDTLSGMGRDINGCPDAYATSTTGRHTMIMVTQTGRGEVAVIDMTNLVVIDEDPSVPGTEFLPIGAIPVSIVSTPGGVSTFVATAEPGREAIFVLPTSCIVAPAANSPPHDLTEWSACKLPAAPGEMTLLADTFTASGNLRRTCDGDGVQDIDPTSRADCPADWDAEQRVSPAGRRKLLVTLPSLGGIAILDARNLFDRSPGSFDPCNIERWLPLTNEVPSGVAEQTIPDDLKPTGPQSQSCNIAPRYSFGPTPNGFVSQPAGIAYKDGQLYVADLKTPLVHVVDLKDPCDPHELPPLLPSSFDEPSRTVFTSDVAVSELTSKNQRFVYAVDDDRGNLMVFDVSPASAQRTPKVRPGSPYLPFEAPDRIQTNLQNARVRDLLFITHDVPFLDTSVQNAETGIMCDPSPDASKPASDYRTSSDYTRGAAPSKLRGTFAMVALSDGHIGVVDVEDWDAPCRRPTEGNMSLLSTEADWRGCYGDKRPSYIDTSTGIRTVSDESTCNVVEPHHARSGRFLATNTTVGTGAPSLQTFPTLTSVTGSIATSGSSRNSSSPKLLAVPFLNNSSPPNTWSEVYVGSTLYYTPSTTSPSDPIPSNASLLNIAPATANNNSLLLPLIEPRTYLPSESFSASFEGKLFDDRQTGLLASDQLRLSDPDAHFCDQGVQDFDLTSQIGDFAAVASTQSAAFADSHTDFVQITSDFSDNDPYWSTPIGAACAKDSTTGISGINGCRTYFGITDTFKPTRELTVVEAYQDHLMLQPKVNDANSIVNLHCCFPSTAMYTVRAANQWLVRGQQPMSKITVGDNLRCVSDCSPRKSNLRNRAFEISSTDTKCPDTSGSGSCTCNITDSSGLCGIGPSLNNNSLCVVGNNLPVNPTDASLPAACIFNSLKARFAIYSGMPQASVICHSLGRFRGGLFPTSSISPTA